MARLASGSYQSSSSGYGPSHSSGGSGEISNVGTAMFFGILGLIIGLALAGLLWIIGWALHWAFAWNFGRAVMATRGWWIGWPIAMALIGAVFGLILAIELRKVS